MKSTASLLAIFTVLTAQSLRAEPPSKLKPLMAVPDQAVLQDDFSKQHELKKGVWKAHQGTRWQIADGVLQGQQSSAEYQAKKKDHFGYEARISIPVTPAEFVAEFSFRFIEGKETALVPFIEFNHHVCRVRFSKNGTSLLSDHEVMKLAEAKDFIWESGKWYHALAEMQNGEFVFQIADGPTFYAKRDSFKTETKSGGNGFGIAGPRKGKVELDNMTIWTVKKEKQAGWEKSRAAFPTFEPVQVKKPKIKKPKA